GWGLNASKTREADCTGHPPQVARFFWRRRKACSPSHFIAPRPDTLPHLTPRHLKYWPQGSRSSSRDDREPRCERPSSARLAEASLGRWIGFVGRQDWQDGHARFQRRVPLQNFWGPRTAWGASSTTEPRPNAQPRGAIQANSHPSA